MENQVPETPVKIPEENRKPKKKKGRKAGRIIRRIIVILLILAVLGGLGWYLITNLKAQYTVTYQEYTASTGSISNALSFNGTLQAVNSQTCTANSDATVRAVYAQAEQPVKAGDKLMRLSTGQTVEADFDGTVNVMNYAAGDTVYAGDTLCQIVDFTHMKVSIRVDEYDINSVHTGDAIRISTTANEKNFTSTVAAINHTSSSSGAVAYYTATAYVDVDSEVFPGMQVTVTLPQEEANDVVVLKMDAVSFDEENTAFVYTKDEKGEMTKTYIGTGVSNGTYVEVKSGLASGDKVYTEVEVKADSGVTSLLSGLFGGSRVMPGGPGNMPGGGSGGSGGFSFDPSNMPSFGGGSGGSGGGFPGFGGGSGSGGPGGGFGGGSGGGGR